MEFEPPPSPSAPPPRLLSLDPDRLVVRRADATELLDLRWRVLRAGLPFEEAKFDADALPTTLHFGAFEGSAESTAGGVAVCCTTFALNSWEGRPAWQLRGMATDGRYRGRGVGREVLAFAEASLPREPAVGVLWCNARVPALRFYQSQGWQVVSEQFDIPTAGPHRKMMKVRA